MISSQALAVLAGLFSILLALEYGKVEMSHALQPCARWCLVQLHHCPCACNPKLHYADIKSNTDGMRSTELA